MIRGPRGFSHILNFEQWLWLQRSKMATFVWDSDDFHILHIMPRGDMGVIPMISVSTWSAFLTTNQRVEPLELGAACGQLAVATSDHQTPVDGIWVDRIASHCGRKDLHYPRLSHRNPKWLLHVPGGHIDCLDSFFTHLRMNHDYFTTKRSSLVHGGRVTISKRPFLVQIVSKKCDTLHISHASHPN